ncbi:MAG: DUF1553 domain-containing protein [Planctomycetaceae bacterium]
MLRDRLGGSALLVATWTGISLLGFAATVPQGQLAQAAGDAAASDRPESQADSDAAPLDPEHIEFFEKKIRPVLVKHCYECHAADAETVRGGLLLDTRAATRKGGDSGPSLVPGKSAESLLLDALRYESYQMPPSGKLPDTVIADFETWVKLGAPDPRDGTAAVARQEIDLDAGRRFWSFQPIAKPEPPMVRDAEWPATEIDRFILADLEAANLAPAKPAERPALLRRAYFDLTGLPPSPDEIREFLDDDRPDAFARVVDRLLESPRFGERWGRHWLDVARYADSTGGGRSLILRDAWRYRDYVIRSFEDDKPYDRFVLEQLAGDLLPEAESLEQNQDRLIATGFIELGPLNYETQNKELLRMDAIDEQIDTVGAAFLGMTIGCARCHDHKFDPVPTSDYYALAGIFRSTHTLTPGNVSGFLTRTVPVEPEVRLAQEKNAAVQKELAASIKAAEDDLQAAKAQLPGGAVAGVDRNRPLDPALLAGVVLEDHDAKLIGDWKPSTYTNVRVGKQYVHDDNSRDGNKIIEFTAALPEAGEYEIRFAYNAAATRASNVPVTIRHADGEITVPVNQRLTGPIGGLFVSLGSYRFDETAPAVVTISNTDTDGHVIVDALQFVRAEEIQGDGLALRTDGGTTSDDPLSPERLAELEARMQAVTAELQKLRDELAEVRKDAPALPVAMAVADLKVVGDYHICIRGNSENLGPKVPRGFLSVVGGAAAEIPEGQSGRLQLARWIASRENPLTARVMVNRIWHHLLGRGLVRTVDNFGATGEKPSHPLLLDWLADRFAEDGWSVKATIRRIMLSRTYQQAMVANDAAAARDPENRLLWRMNRRRLDAESIRDTILLLAGNLDETAGGPSVPQSVGYDQQHQHESRRRSVYLPMLRNNVEEMLFVFDFANPNMVSGRRTVSTLATQALYLMNSPFVQEQSRGAAKRLLAREGLDRDARIAFACEETLGRPPNQSERKLLLSYLDPADPESSADLERAWGAIYHALFACVDFRYLD